MSENSMERERQFGLSIMSVNNSMERERQFGLSIMSTEDRTARSMGTEESVRFSSVMKSRRIELQNMTVGYVGYVSCMLNYKT
jgi:hypothetical protein